MIANSEKMKMKKTKKSYPIFVSPPHTHTDFLKQFLPLPNYYPTLSSRLKKEWDGVEN